MFFDVKLMAKDLKSKPDVYGLLFVIIASILIGVSSFIFAYAGISLGVFRLMTSINLSKILIFGIATTISVFVFGVFYALLLGIAFKILKTRFSYGNSLKIIGYSFTVFGVWALLSSLLFLIPFLGFVLSALALWLGFVHSISLKISLSRELFNTDLLTSFIAVVIVVVPLVVTALIIASFTPLILFTTLMAALSKGSMISPLMAG